MKMVIPDLYGHGDSDEAFAFSTDDAEVIELWLSNKVFTANPISAGGK